MILPFEYEFAKKVVEGGIGRLTMRSGREVVITDWKRDHNTHPIVGYAVDLPDVKDYWMLNGRITDKHDNDTTFDLVLEVFSDCLIKFDSELAKEALEFELGEIRTRRGKKVTITDWGGKDKKYPITGILFYGPKSEMQVTYTWTEEGIWSPSGEPSEEDLLIYPYFRL